MADDAQLQIINTALGQLGQEPVPDLGEASLQASMAATKLLRHVEVARDTVLRRHGWTCALEYVVLSPATLDGYVNWRYPIVYQLPANALRVWEIAGERYSGAPGTYDADCWAPRWQCGAVETDTGAAQVIRALNADAGLNVAYVRRANWASLDAHLADAVAWDLAARACYNVTGAVDRTSQLKKYAEEKVMLAISAGDTQEGGQPPLMGSIPARLRNLAR